MILIDQLFSVQNKVVLVSGGSRGIGLALARGYAQRGAKVIISGREIETLEKSALEISTGEHMVKAIKCDVTKTDQIDELLARVCKEYGRIDTFLNVAGVSKRKNIETFTPEEFDFILDINLRGAFFISQSVGRIMIGQKQGSIINVDSLNTYAPLKGVGVYAMSKAGVLMMTRAQAMEWGPKGIRVNSISPGFFPTYMTQATWKKNHMIEWVKENTPLKKLGHVDELVGVAIFLGSKASEFVTGQNIRVDGGITAGINWPLNIDG